MRLKLAVLISCFILSSCIGTKYLKEGETILYKQDIIGDESLDTETLTSFYSQTPNSRILVFPVSPFVYIYQSGRRHYDSLALVKEEVALEKKYDLKIENTETVKKKKRLEAKKLKKTEKLRKRIEDGNLFMKWGEPLAVYDKRKAAETEAKLRDYLFSKGYFNSTVKLETNEKNGTKKIVNYKIDQGHPYVMDSIILIVEDPRVKTMIERKMPGSSLKGKKYDQDLISAERDKVFEMLSNNGYFNFKKQYVHFDVDSTTLSDHRLIVKEIISNPLNEKEHRVYTIDSVRFVAGGDGPRKVRRSVIKYYNNITYDFTYGRYPQRILDWRMFIYPDSAYNKSATIETQKQLSYLDIFKFVNINYDTTGGKFIANIFTSPLKKYQTSSELGLSVVDLDGGSGYPGPFFNFNAKNRNVFQSLEILNLDLNTSIQGVPSVQERRRLYSKFQYGGQASVTFPQFILPLSPSARGRLGKYNPRTKLALGVNFENRISEYNRTTFNTSYAYLFQVNQTSQFTYKFLDVSFIKSNNRPDFKEDLDELEAEGNISYVSAFKSAFISSTSIGLDYNSGEYGLGNSTSYFIRSALEYGGLAQLFFGKEPLGQGRIGSGLTYYKYVKGNFDFRNNIRLSANSAIAYRANIGIAYVYGDNQSMPYEKYFFAGGSNSIRAWSPRRVGPGSYASYDDTSTAEDVKIDYKREQPGDIIFESSVEFRSSLISIIDYALFIDAGNVWLWRSKTLNTNEDPQGDNGVFDLKTAFGELAVGTGAGLRLDFSFLVLRLDAAYKVFDPGMGLGNRFVLNEVRFDNLLKKTTLNIGIGYPF